MIFSLIYYLCAINPLVINEHLQYDGLVDEKIGLDINMTYFRNIDRSVTLLAEVYDAEEDEAVTDLEFEFYSMSDADDILLGRAFSNAKAMVELAGIPHELIYRDKADKMLFRLVGENEVYSGSFDLAIRHANLVLNFDIIDSVKVLSVELIGKDDDGAPVGIEDGEVYFSVPRSFFGALQIGDVWTDANGYDKMKFPDDIPGDEFGNITVIAKISDSEELGNIELAESINWGVPPEYPDDNTERSLWASGANAPIYLLILTNSLIAATWGIIFYIIFQIYKISKS